MNLTELESSVRLHVVDCAAMLASGVYKNVVVLTGAGVSTSSGLPDFGGRGVSAAKWDAVESELRDILPSKEPTETHRMLFELAKRGWIRRVYTQNVDGLHEKSGLNTPILCRLHGAVDLDQKNSSNEQTCAPSIASPFASSQTCVRMGEKLPDEFWTLVEEDFALRTKCPSKEVTPPDLILVLGTSLQVAPACAIPNMARKKTPRWWICLRPPHQNGFEPSKSESFAGPQKCVTIGKVRISTRLTMRKRKADRVFDVPCDEFAREVMRLLEQQTIE